MTFKDRPFAARFNAMGDEAEGVFEKVYPQGFERFGLKRPRLNVGMLPEFVKYAPDYLTAKGFVEVQGFGSDRTFKLKLDKWDALEAWNAHFRTDLFVYDSFTRTYGWIRLDDLGDEWGTGVVKQFSEGKDYWATHRDNLPVVGGEWAPAP